MYPHAHHSCGGDSCEDHGFQPGHPCSGVSGGGGGDDGPTSPDQIWAISNVDADSDHMSLEEWLAGFKAGECVWTTRLDCS